MFPSEKAPDNEIESGVVDVTAAEVKDTPVNTEDELYSRADDHKEVKGTAVSDNENTKETTTQVVENQVSGISSFFFTLRSCF